jgi:outer membrane immunogenic protein
MKRVVIGLVAAATLGFGNALAADMPLKAAPMAPPPPPSWTGFYIGGNVGVDWTHNTGTWSPLPSATAFGAFGQTGTTGGDSALGGIQGGYNWQFAPTWVAGIEGDMSWTKASGAFRNQWVNPATGTVVLPASFTEMSTSLDWMSSVRARLGFLVVPSVLLYGTAGGAWGKIDYAADNSRGAVPAYLTNTAFSNTVGGWVAGGGLEWMMNANWLLRWEYLHYGFNNSASVVANDTTGNFPTFPSGYSWTKTNVDAVRWALSYKF